MASVVLLPQASGIASGGPPASSVELYYIAVQSSPAWSLVQFWGNFSATIYVVTVCTLVCPLSGLTLCFAFHAVLAAAPVTQLVQCKLD